MRASILLCLALSGCGSEVPQQHEALDPLFLSCGPFVFHPDGVITALSESTTQILRITPRKDTTQGFADIGSSVDTLTPLCGDYSDCAMISDDQIIINARGGDTAHPWKSALIIDRTSGEFRLQSSPNVPLSHGTCEKVELPPKKF